MGEYTETSKLLQNGNSNRRVYTRKILFYTVICASVTAFFMLLLLFLLSNDNMRKQSPVNLEEVDRVSSKFADWTEEQFKTHFMDFLSDDEHCEPKNSTISYESYEDDFPISVDWREKGVIGDVINQLECNICWQVSIVQVMESMVAIRRNAPVTSLSIQELIDCFGRPTCQRGNPQKAVETMHKTHMSIVTEKQYPLSLKVEQCQYKNMPYPKGVIIKDYQVACKVTKNDIMRLISRHGPVIATVDTTQWMYYNGGIISYHCSSNMPGHVVQIVGYDRRGEVPHYIVKNSWGTDFGDDGYLYIKMGSNLCGIENHIIALDVEY